jgi:DNA-binding transcriptional LysR family regulator
MELRHLRYFVAVAEELHFRRAAERLGIQQPPLSAQIRHLETELGAPLFRRETRGVTLTEAGETLLGEARQILSRVDQAKVDVGRSARGESGRVRVGFAGAISFHPLVPTTIKTCRSRYPGMIMSPQITTTTQLMAEVRDGGCDVAFVRPPLVDSDGLDIHPLVEEPMLIALPSDHPLAGNAAIPLGAIARDELIVTPREVDPGFYDYVIESCRQAGFAPNLGQPGPQMAALIGMVAAGLGVAIVPECFQQIRPAGVSYHRIEGETPIPTIALIHRHVERSPSVRNFVTVARQCSAAFREPAPAPA